jgi:hypothetical protein
LLGHLQEALPADWQVVVLSDRGLESPRLFRAIVELGWHPLMRVKEGGKYRPAGWRSWYWLRDFATLPGTRLAMKGVAYKGEAMDCTLLA